MEVESSSPLDFVAAVSDPGPLKSTPQRLSLSAQRWHPHVLPGLSLNFLGDLCLDRVLSTALSAPAFLGAGASRPIYCFFLEPVTHFWLTLCLWRYRYHSRWLCSFLCIVFSFSSFSVMSSFSVAFSWFSELFLFSSPFSRCLNSRS